MIKYIFNSTCQTEKTGKFFILTELDECLSNPCLYSGNCTDLVNGYNCTCADGYYGTQCETGIHPQL